MDITARFRRGSNLLDLNSGGYTIDADAIPPPIQLENNVAVGGFANRAGGTLIGQKPLDRQFAFTVRVVGASTSQARALAQALVAFISGAGDILYYEYKDNKRPEPLWGTFDQALRYEVVTAQAALNQKFSDVLNSQGFEVVISLEIKPYATGKSMQACAATNNVAGFEDSIGTVDGSIRGLRFGTGVGSNLVSNYDFSNATWNLNWNAAANIIQTQNTDKRWVFPGKANSARLLSKGAINNTYLYSITAANTNTHAFSAWVRKPDGSAVTSADMVVYYAANLSTTFVSLGNGWYWARATAAGIASPQNFGIVLLNGKSIYLAAVTAQENPFPIGLDSALNLIEINPTDDTDTEYSSRMQISGRVSLTWKADCGNADFTVDPKFFQDSGPALYAYFHAADDKIYLTDGVNTISSAAQTFAAGDVLHLEFSWGPTGLNIYKNGANIANGPTYTPGTAATYYYIGGTGGSDYTYGVYMGACLYDSEPTSGQVTDRYNAAVAITNQDKCLSLIPWATGRAAGGSLINHEDSASHYNHVNAHSIPGNLPAKTRIVVTPSVITLAGYWLMHHVSDFFVAPIGQQYKDLSGTAEAGTTSGDARLDIATVGAVNTNTGLTWTVTKSDYVTGKVHFFARAMHQTGTGVFTLAPLVSYASGNTTLGAAKTVVLTTAWKWWYVGNLDVTIPSIVPANKRSITLGLQFTSNSAADTQARFDYILAVPGSAVKLKSTLSTGWASFIYEGNQALELNSSNNPMQFMGVQGDTIELVPGKANTLWVVQSDHGETNTITPTATVAVYITPRWSLL
jgi:hypothetical protein